MPYRISINGEVRGKLWNGKSIDIVIAAEQSVLLVEVKGNWLSPHKIRKEVVLFPQYCKEGRIRCRVVTRHSWLDTITLGLIHAAGSLEVEVEYY